MRERPMLDQHKAERGILHVSSDFTNKDGTHPLIEVHEDAPALFLFDIDGTLINAKAIHGPAIIELYKQAFPRLAWDAEGFAKRLEQDWFDGWGPGDRLEHELLCKKYNVLPATEEEKQALLDKLVRGYGEYMSSLTQAASDEQRSQMILPGAISLLEETKRRGIPAAIVTGNIRQSAQELLKNLDLAKYFITGGFDDDEGVSNEPYRRANILASAVHKCRQKGVHFPPERMVVFGDTPKDHLATLHSGEVRPRTILTATGDHSFLNLASVRDKEGGRKPYLVVNDLSRLRLDKFFEGLEQQKIRDQLQNIL